MIFAFTYWFACGGYLLVRKSHHWWGPHFAWSGDLKTFRDFSPTPEAHAMMEQRVKDGKWPPFWFRGYVKVGTELP
jgi:hypothetical protein